MNDKYIEKHKSLDKSKLMTKAKVLEHLAVNGEHEPSLAQISSQYESEFGIDPIWRYPLPDEVGNGAFIVPVQEGALWIPYDEIDHDYYEILMLEEAYILDAECCVRLKEELREYADSLYAVLEAIIAASGESMQNEIVTVQHFSIWDDCIEIESTAKVNIRTGEVFGFEGSTNIVDGIEILDREYIELNGKEIEVYQDVNGYDYWADFDGTY